MANKDIQKKEIMKREKIPTHYIQDPDYIIREFIDKIKLSRAKHHSSLYRNEEIKTRLVKLIIDATELNNYILETRGGTK